ncbi:Pyridine nucleotide-disulphide oxidoreductase [Thermanaeromonas toyohensis ToBE]|uniref:Pyridine nucleotide-disulphide oxidoreductase n=1 Tax=Thermanaeromonas toyohensis ToBE TaxID=698762 RepID=A0A1W1VFJ7_9FIRM|nr:FAD-dependent oxidoreductase [Thermanaeromonas toyohensis]SMB91990.1 Pyridine nucleotide-disulphide oxidoreductase [Thermanaeromonas toyohensis ToBE]
MRYLIIGNSAAGVTAAEAIRKMDKKGEIAIVSDEPYPAYSRIFITNILAGTASLENILMRPPDFYEKFKIKAILGQKVIQVDPLSHEAYLEKGDVLSFDRLLLATGASPQLPPVPGSHLLGVTGMRTLADALEVAKRLEDSPGLPVAVIGGGLVSLKSTEALINRGAKIILVVKSTQILSQMLDERAASIIQRRMLDAGIKVMLGYDLVAYEGEKELEAVYLDNGEKIVARLAIVAKGVVPNLELAKGMGLQVNRGIMVNPYQETSQEGIYAAGDVAETYDPVRRQGTVNAMWPNAVFQGEAAGLNMAGLRVPARTGTRVNAASFFGLQAASVGRIRPLEGDEEVTVVDRGNNYHKLIFREESLVGAVLVGDIRNIGYYRWLIAEQRSASSLRQELGRKIYNFSACWARVTPLRCSI